MIIPFDQFVPASESEKQNEFGVLRWNTWYHDT
jgi:hypothetical protein